MLVQYADGIIIDGNVVENAGYNGIVLLNADNCIVSNNVCKNNGQAAANQVGIKLDDSNYNIVTGNRCTDTQSTKTQDYNIYEFATSDYNLFDGNVGYGNDVDNTVITTGANSVEADNIP